MTTVVQMRQRRTTNRALLLAHLNANPCVDCGEADPVVLELDHRDGEEKLQMVSRMVLSGYAEASIRREIAKCDVRCTNCHKRRTAKQQSWSKNTIH